MPMASRFMRKSAATSERAKWLDSGTPPTRTTWRPNACSRRRAAVRGPIAAVSERETRCARAKPSGVGSIEQLMPGPLAPSAARRATTKSSSISTGRLVVEPTVLPSASTFQPSAGPAKTMSPGRPSFGG